MTNYTNLLNPGQQLNVNDTLTSSNGDFQLILQSDGNLCLYWLSNNHTCTWASETSGKTAQFAIMQADGNFVIYESQGGAAIWASNTCGDNGAYITMQSDGNLVIYLGSNPVWASNTDESSSSSSSSSPGDDDGEDDDDDDDDDGDIIDDVL